MTPQPWIRVGTFAAGGAIYIGLFDWFLVSTFQATTAHPASIPDGYTTVALALSGAIAGFLAKTLGVPPPGGSSSILVRPNFVTPSQVATVVLWTVVITYIAIGILCGVADVVHQNNPALVPAVVSAQWKIMIGFIVATFANGLNNA